MNPAHDISIDYLGLKLASPLIPSASPLGERVETLQEMENCGAGAVVLPSLFETPCGRNDRSPAYYCAEVARAKGVLKIPVIASVSATTLAGWKELARQVAEAGADAVELNVYHLSLSPDVASSVIEQAYMDIAKTVRQSIDLPFSIKLPPFFTNLTFVARELRKAGASGLVLFNRFYQPDLDLLSMSPGYSLRLSTSAENRLSLRWISLLYQYDVGYLAASTGIRSGADALKMIFAGASAVQVCSILLQRGIGWLKEIERELHDWMDRCKIVSLREARGTQSLCCRKNLGEIEREEYSRALQGYALLDVPSWRDEVPVHTYSKLSD